MLNVQAFPEKPRARKVEIPGRAVQIWMGSRAFRCYLEQEQLESTAVANVTREAALAVSVLLTATLSSINLMCFFLAWERVLCKNVDL